LKTPLSVDAVGHNRRIDDAQGGAAMRVKTKKTAQIEGILLAAGESRRMGYPKPLLLLNGQSFLAHIATTMLTAVSRLIIVLGAHQDSVRAAIPANRRIMIVENPNYRLGQLSSMKEGLRAVSAEADAVIVHLVDHPTVMAETFRRLITEHQATGTQIVVARSSGHPGHPVLFHRSVFSELAQAPIDVGARAVVRANVDRVAYLDVDDPGVVLDLDTPADLVRAGLPPVPTP
jgi:molybdenum cofactor cytidylyltransferase